MSISESDLFDNWLFAEAWIDTSPGLPYVLMLLSDNVGNCCIYDPAEGNQVVFTSSNYEDAKLWLLEDEYERVEGRLEME